MRRTARGFTLVEVLVALSILAVISVVTWQGVDTMVRTRDATRGSVDRTLRVHAAVSQFEADLRALHDSGVADALRFDGASLRLTRSAPEGVQAVAWTVREGVWQRWVGGVTAQADALQQDWLASLQLTGGESGTLPALDGVVGWQLHYFRNNAWTNAQSAADTIESARNEAPGGRPAPRQPELPSGVRLVLELKEGTVTRELALVQGGGR